MEDFLENKHNVARIICTIPSVILLHSPYAQRIIAWRTDRVNQIDIVLEFRILYISVSYIKTEHKSLRII
jgi:hypothetical protein